MTAQQTLHADQRRELLRVAREDAKVVLHQSTAGSDVDPAFASGFGEPFGGVFVTLWNGDRLRGCRGLIMRIDDLPAAVREATRLSLTDPRFAGDPIVPDELPELSFEVSVLTDPQPTDDPLGMEIGRHGVIIRRGRRSGCFLPKVAAERGWSALECLQRCCEMKAGLSPDAWQNAETQVLLFTAESFRDGGDAT